MPAVLVTGGAGFIGSHLVERLVAEGLTVRVLDNLSTGKRENIESFAGSIEFVEGDIRDRELLAQLVDGIEVVFHLAANPSVQESVENPLKTHDVNLGGTLNVFEAARKSKVRRLVFSSSTSVYGDTAQVPTPEDSPLEPMSPYGLQKLFCEKICKMANDEYGLETAVLRYFNVFGERQNVASQYAAVIPNFITRLQRGKQPEIYGDGEQTRDFIYVGDVAEVTALAGSHPGAAGKVFNIASGKAVTVNALAETCARVLGKDIKPSHSPERKGDIKFSTADTTRAETVLGFSPKTALEDGLRRTAEYIS
ncbi:MAG: SDR family oxidoreductase [Planctomycetota bacterium]|jgi:UDP-glucose 4-epimerase